MTNNWISYALNACVVGVTLLLAKIAGQIVTEAQMMNKIELACQMVVRTMMEREQLVMRDVATRGDIADAIKLAIEAFSAVDLENDRLIVERYTEPLRMLVERQQAQMDRFITSLEHLNENMIKLFANRQTVP